MQVDKVKLKKVLCLINPISGGLDKSAFKESVSSFVEKNGFSITFHETTGENDLEKLGDAIQESQPEILMVCGGDCTINLAATCLQNLKETIPVCIIPLGSANGMAKDLRLPEDPAKAQKLILHGKILDVDVLKVNDRFSVHLSDLGFNAKLIRKFETSGQRGKWNYARHFFSILKEQTTSSYSILIDNEVLNTKAQMVAFANAKTYGTGAIINPKGRFDDGKFEVCIFKPYPWYALVGITWRFFTGNITTSPYVRILSTTETTVLVNPEEMLQIDGEVIGPVSKVEVTVSPVPFRVYSP